jgi:hypothetical protein
MLNKQTDVSEQEVDKNISEKKWKFEVGDFVLQFKREEKSEGDMIPLNGGIYVTALNFDFETNICKVQF